MAKTVSLYTIANIINSAIPVILLPILTKHLTPAEYGIAAMFQVLVQFLSPFAGLNHTAALSRQYFDLDKENFKSYIGNGIYVLVFSSLFLIGMLMLFRTQISAISEFPIQWLWVVGIYSFANNLALTLLTLWQVKYKAKEFGLFRISRTLTDFGLSILLIVGFGYTWDGRIAGSLFAIIPFSLFALILLMKNKSVNFKFNWDYIKDNIKLGAPLIPHTIGGALILFSDRIILTHKLGLDAQGLYSVGYTVAMIVYLFQNSFNQAWVPTLFEKLKSNNFKSKLKIVKFTYLYFIIMPILVALVSFVAPWVFDTFLDKNYSSAIEFVFWIAIGFGFNGMYKMVVNYIFYLKKNYIISIITISTAGLNIFLNIILINRNGAIGAAQASAISFFIQFIATWIISSRLYKMPWSLKLSRELC